MANSSRSDQEPLPDPTRRNGHWLVYQFLLRTFLPLWLRYRARGVEKLPAEGGGLLLINHQSTLDPILVGLPLRRPVTFLARDSLFRIPGLRSIIRNLYGIPISRESTSTATIRQVVERMRHGFLVGVFPEGTRTRDGTVGPLKPGFVALVRRGKVPVYPVGIAGAVEALPRDGWWIRPVRVRIVFGDPLPAEEIERHLRRGEEEHLIALARERITRCQQEAEAWRKR